MVEMVNQVLTTATLLAHILLIAGLAMFIYTRIRGKKARVPAFLTRGVKFLSRHSYTLAFALTVFSVMTSLFWSEVLKFPPCNFCWYQRIFMFPQPFLFYTAIIRNERVLKPYLLVMNGIGLFVALYHHAMQIFPQISVISCQANGGVSCLGYSFYKGYITFPLMSATAFLMVIILLLLSTEHKKYA